MTGEFMIVHPETGEEYGLSDVADFTETYQPRGFVIADPQPNGWVAPKVPAKAKHKAASEPGDDDANSRA